MIEYRIELASGKSIEGFATGLQEVYDVMQEYTAVTQEKVTVWISEKKDADA